MTSRFIYSLPDSFWTAFMDVEPVTTYRTKWALACVCFSFFFLVFFVSG